MAVPRNLSKSKLVAFRQCPKRLWLELHRPELAEVSERTQAIFRAGHAVGDIARRLYDKSGDGTLIDLQQTGVEGALNATQQLLPERKPLFEAGFAADGALAFSDVLLPVGRSGWRMVEVKASGSVKDYQRDDVAIQSYIARSAGVSLEGAALAHIDTQWRYPGGEDYEGLLTEVDLTAEAASRAQEVTAWLRAAQAVASAESPPQVDIGPHCATPFACPFDQHCKSGLPAPAHPVSWLPRVQSKSLKNFLQSGGVTELVQVPDSLLNDVQRRVKDATLQNRTYFDLPGAQADLAGFGGNADFLDFETIAFAVPIWEGTRPFQQIPFQFSLHRVAAGEAVRHLEFIDLSGNDPSRRFAEALIATCAPTGPIFAYNASFESGRIAELAEQYPDLRVQLQAIRVRIVDLLPIAARRFYHPIQKGSWSIKSLLPAVAPELTYEALEGVADGGMAQAAYIEATGAGIPALRRQQLQEQLLSYCKLDTLALVRVWEVFSGRKELQ